MAGPQLFAHTQSPWRAPGGTLYTDTSTGVAQEKIAPPPGWLPSDSARRALWKKAGVDDDSYIIPCPLTAAQTPQASCNDQRQVNRFLTYLNKHAMVPNTPAPAERVKVVVREVSSENEKKRGNEFEHTRFTPQGGKVAEQWVGVTSPDGQWTGVMPLSDYSMTVGMAKSALQLQPGTVVLVASRATIAQTLDTADTQRFLARSGVPFRSGVPDLNSMTADEQKEIKAMRDARSSDGVWHNCAVAAIDFDDGERTSKRVYVYDPSYPNARIDAKTGKTAPEVARDAGQIPRLADFLMLANAGKLVGEWRQKKDWINDNLFIGGGGNIHGLDECRPMSLNWMQQFWVLATELQVAKEKANKGLDPKKKPTKHRSDKDWKKAHSRLKDAFLHNFEQVRLSSR